MKHYYWLFFMVCIFGWTVSVTFHSVTDSFANKNESKSYYESCSLTEINHPDLFFWKWAARASTISNNTQENSEPDTETSSSAIIERPQRLSPIPLNELDGSLVQRVHFGYDKDLLNASAKSGIQINIEWIKKHKEYDILLEGHCDERGTDEYNIALGDRRASAVREYMIRMGVDPKRIISRSYGEEKPLDVRKMASAYSLNRRVEFYAVP